MAKKKRKFSIEERAEYHSNRLKNPSVSENKKLYSRHWLYGFKDTHAKTNLSSLRSEKEYRKKIGQYDKSASCMYNGSIAGTKARIDLGSVIFNSDKEKWLNHLGEED